MSTPAEDVAWIRRRALKLVDEGMDHEDALAQACQERVDWKEEQQRAKTRAGRIHKPLRVSLGDLLKARGRR